jgi:hypothetical protein
LPEPERLWKNKFQKILYEAFLTCSPLKSPSSPFIKGGWGDLEVISCITPMPNDPNDSGLRFGIWSLELICNLALVIWCFC